MSGKAGNSPLELAGLISRHAVDKFPMLQINKEQRAVKLAREYKVAPSAL